MNTPTPANGKANRMRNQLPGRDRDLLTWMRTARSPAAFGERGPPWPADPLARQALAGACAAFCFIMTCWMIISTFWVVQYRARPDA